ncbi:polysaccharide biosynthesis tyrosine autokinase [bacterium]|nr:polysaccharide biosynthesis tyrosine autokinase [bacterium]
MDNEGSMNLYRYLSIVFKYKWLVLLLFLILFISGMFVVMKSQEMYAAQTKILVNYQMSGTNDMSRYFMSGTIRYLVKTYSLTIVSNQVLEKTRKILDLPYSIGYLRSHLFVETEEGTNLIKVSGTLPDKEHVALFINTLIDQYIILQTGFMTEDSVKAKNYIQEQLQVVGADRKCIQEKIRDFKEKNGIVDVKTEMQNLVERFSALRLSKTTSIMERKSVNETLAKVNRELSKIKDSGEAKIINDIETSPEYAAYKKLQQEYEEASMVYKEGSSYIKAVKIKLDDLKNKLFNRISSTDSNVSLLSLYSQKTLLEQRLVELNYEIVKTDFILQSMEQQHKSIPEKEMEYQDLMADLTINEKLYNILLEQEKELELAKITQGSTIRVVDRAIQPSRPITTSKVRYLLFITLLALIVSVGFAFLIEYIDTTVKPSDNIEKIFDANLIGKIPEIYKGDEKLSKWAIITGQRAKYITRSFKENLITNISKKSTINESYKELRTLLSYSKEFKNKEGAKTMLVTSSETKEGKSITGANLSIILSLNRKKTVLIDADMRKPAQHRIFERVNNVGLTDYFESSITDVKKIIQAGVNPYHDLITCGPHTHNSSEYLDSPKVFELIDKLSALGYEYIIFDTPPVNALTDAVVLSNKLDGVLFVIRSNQIGRHRVQIALENIKKSGGNILGLILNGIPLRGGYGYYYYYYGQTYYYSYDDVDANEEKKA